MARRFLLGYRHTHQIHVDVHAILWFMERALVRARAESGVSIYNLSNDDVEQNTFASLLRKAEAVRGPPHLPSAARAAIVRAIRTVLQRKPRQSVGRQRRAYRLSRKGCFPDF